MTPYYDPGLYRCRITDQGFNEASTGTAQFWIQFSVLQRIEPYDDSLEQYSRRAYFAITERTAHWVMDDLHTLGFKGDSFEGVDPGAKGYHSFIGTEIEWFCTHENDQNGNPRERWGPRGRGRLLDADKIRKLNRLLFKKPQSANGSIVEENDSAKITDPDVPF